MDEAGRRHQELSRLALTIRRAIEKSGLCTLAAKDMAVIWQAGDEEAPDFERRMSVTNFARQFGFVVIMDLDLAGAIFTLAE